MKYENNFYLTSDLSLDIEFLFVDHGSTVGWRAYILSNINYKSRSTACYITHRLTEKTELGKAVVRSFLHQNRRALSPTTPIYYICWSTPIFSLEEMKSVAKVWSEITAYYIKYGGEFGTIQKKLKSLGII